MGVSGTNNLIGGATPGARNLISGNGVSGALSLGGFGNRVRGNYIGTDITGTQALGNLGGGVSMGDGLNNVLGGTNPGEGNLISGNGSAGVGTANPTTLIQGNLIGTDRTGTVALPNAIGIRAMRGLIGGTTPQARNIISGNTGASISLSLDTRVQGNYIGTDITGLRALGNGTGITLSGTQQIDAVIGGTQPGARNLISGNRGDGINTEQEALLVRIEGNFIGIDDTGAALGNGGNGILLRNAQNVVVGGSAAACNVISGNALNGISFVDPSSGSQVQGNYIGTNAAGTAALANGRHGVHMNSSLFFATITLGGTSADMRNLISGNLLDGVRLEGASTGFNFSVQGNYIGTDAAGGLALPNRGSGVVVNGGANVVIGGAAPGTGNVISGNAGDGISLFNSGTRVEGNRIGTNAAGTGAIENTRGLFVRGMANVIGGPAAGAGNIISGNRGNGLELDQGSGHLVQGNRFGTDLTGAVALANGGVGVAVATSDNTVSDNVIAGNQAKACS